MGAQLTLLALENQGLQSGLKLKEEKKNSQQNVLFVDGRGKETTGDVFYELRKNLDAKVSAAKAETERNRADRAAQKAIWVVQKEEHDKKEADLAAQGLLMARAGPPPLLRDVLLPGETRESANGPTTAKNILQRKKRVCHGSSESINLLLGKDFDPDSDDESEVWSAHDESDPE